MGSSARTCGTESRSFLFAYRRLRERVADIPALATHFALRAAKRLGLSALNPSATDLQQLIAYSWPGNVRELSAVIKRAAILGEGKRLDVARALGAAATGRPATAIPELHGHTPPLAGSPSIRTVVPEPRSAMVPSYRSRPRSHPRTNRRTRGGRGHPQDQSSYPPVANSEARDRSARGTLAGSEENFGIEIKI